MGVDGSKWVTSSCVPTSRTSAGQSGALKGLGEMVDSSDLFLLVAAVVSVL